MTAAAVMEAQRMREEAEAAALAEEEEENEEPEIELIDTLPGVDASYSFSEIAPEATLPPSN